MSDPAAAHPLSATAKASSAEVTAPGAAPQPFDLPPLPWSALSKGECLLLAVTLHRLSRANLPTRT